MLHELLAMYEEGAITGYQVMVDCLHKLDPDEPDLVLGLLPDEILEEMLAYARRYDPHRSRSAPPVPPAEDQVRAAERWIHEHRLKSSRTVNR
jgi:hypothetical protein